MVNIFTTVKPLLRRQVVSQATGKPKSTLYRDIQRGLFPKPVEIGGGSVAWPSNEVDAMNKARIAGKSDDEIKLLVIELEAARGTQ